MKIAIFSSYGGSELPAQIKEILKNESFIESREKLADFVLSFKSQSVNEEKISNLKKGHFIRNKNKLYFKTPFVGNHLTMKSIEVVNIDTSKPWTIEEYDGAEYIEYLDYKLIDEKSNYHEKVIS